MMMGLVRDSFLAILVGLVASACGGADEPEDTTPATRDNHDFDIGAGSGVALAGDDGGVEAVDRNGVGASPGASMELGESPGGSMELDESAEEDRHVPQEPLPPPAEENQPPPVVQSPPVEEPQAPKKPQLPPD